MGECKPLVVGASIPPFVPGMAFGLSASKGLFEAGYKVGKQQAEDYAKNEFGPGAVVLKPGRAVTQTPDCLLIVYPCARAHSPHPPPWPDTAS